MLLLLVSVELNVYLSGVLYVIGGAKHAGYSKQFEIAWLS